MRVGDLVRFRRSWLLRAGVPDALGMPIAGLVPDALGLIIEAARHGVPSYKIWWTAQNKTGWWDAHRLKKVESNK